MIETIKKEYIENYRAFDKKWFLKNQNILLFLLNTPILKNIFRKVMAIKTFDLPLHEKIAEITPNSFSYGERYIYINGEVRLERTTDFRTHAKFSKRIYYAFKPVWWLMHYWDEILADKYVPALSFGFSTLTAYPTSGTSGTTTSGYITREDGPGSSWATTRGAASGGAVNAGGNYISLEAYEHPSLSNYFSINRGFANFDTSAITSGGTISAATISLYGNDKTDGDNDGDNFIAVVLSTQADVTNLTTSDYSALGTTEQHDSGERKSITTISTSAYTNWAFNSTGIGNISKTGISKFGFREGHDLLNNAISNNTDSYYRAYNAAQSGTTNDPKLVVTYSTSTAYTKNLTETVTLVQTQLKKPTKPFSEVVTLVASLASALTKHKALTETVTLVETLLKLPKKVALETVTLVETFARQTQIYRLLTEVVTLVETIDTTKVAQKALTETIAIADTIVRLPGKALTEVVALVETFAKQITLSRVYTETVTLVETFGSIKFLSQAINETITLVENVKKDIAKSFTLVITIVQTFASTKVYNRTFSEIITLVASIATGLIKRKALTETITLVETIKRKTTKVLTEVITLVQRFLGLKNGNDISYTAKYEDRPGTYTQKYEDRSGTYKKKYLDF